MLAIYSSVFMENVEVFLTAVGSDINLASYRQSLTVKNNLIGPCRLALHR